MACCPKHQGTLCERHYEYHCSHCCQKKHNRWYKLMRRGGETVAYMFGLYGLYELAAYFLRLLE